MNRALRPLMLTAMLAVLALTARPAISLLQGLAGPAAGQSPLSESI